MKYMGTRTSSQKMKKSTRSREMNVPAIPVSSRSIRERRPLALRGSGSHFME